LREQHARELLRAPAPAPTTRVEDALRLLDSFAFCILHFILCIAITITKKEQNPKGPGGVSFLRKNEGTLEEKKGGVENHKKKRTDEFDFPYSVCLSACFLFWVLPADVL
jgi:hypothetical protein